MKRIEWIDIAKGIGILAVILGHCNIPRDMIIYSIIYSFHMPLFFIIGGLFFRNDVDFNILIRKKAKVLIRPYYYTCFAIIILSAFLAYSYEESVWVTVREWIYASLYASGAPVFFDIKFIGAIWFLWAMFWGILFLYIALRIKYSSVFVIVVFLIGCISREYWLPFSVQAGMVATIYLYIGYLIKSKNLIKYIIDIRTLIISTLIWGVGLYFGCGTIYLVANYYRLGIFDFFISIVSVFSVLGLSYYIQKIEVLGRILQYFGRNSLKILCFHIIELNLFHWYSIININHPTKIIYLLKIAYSVTCITLLDIIRKNKSII